MTSSIPDVSKSKNRLKSKPEYNFFKRPDRLSDRSDVTSDKVDFKSDIRQFFFSKRSGHQEFVILKKNWSNYTFIDIKRR